MSKELQLLEALGQLPDAYILDAHRASVPARSARRRYVLIAAVAAVLCLLAGCAALVWHWYSTYFTLQREAPLSDSQVTYIQGHAQDIRESQTYDGYTIEFLSAIGEEQGAYLTFRITGPEDLSYIFSDDSLLFQRVTARPVGTEMPRNLGFRFVKDEDGNANTVNLVLEIHLNAQSDAAFGADHPWEVVFQGLRRQHYDKAYEEELLRTKYAGVEGFMFEDEEIDRLYTWETLSDATWHFELTLDSADTDSIELVSAPFSTPAIVTRRDRTEGLAYDTKEFVESVTVTSIRLHAFGATVTFQPPEDKEGTDFPNFFSAWFDMGDMYNPLTELVRRDENFFVMLKDGTRIDFFQYTGATSDGTAELTADSPLVLENIDYLQLSDGTRLYAK